MNNKGADQTACMRSLVCTFVIRKPPKTGFLALILILLKSLHSDIKDGGYIGILKMASPSIPEASSTMGALLGTLCTNARLCTLRIKIGT